MVNQEQIGQNAKTNRVTRVEIDLLVDFHIGPYLREGAYPCTFLEIGFGAELGTCPYIGPDVGGGAYLWADYDTDFGAELVTHWNRLSPLV